MGLRLVSLALLASLVILFSPAAVAAKPIRTAADTSLRQSPGADGDVLRLIPKGSKVDIAGCSNGWCRISFKGQDGFAMAVNFEIVKTPNLSRGPVTARPDTVSSRPPIPRPRPATIGGSEIHQANATDHGSFAEWLFWKVCGQR